jgi:hypothetical protein
MPKSSRLFACLVICLSFILAACLAQVENTRTARETAPSPTSDQPAADQQKDTFEVVAWVDNPTPASGEQVNLSGSLIKNKVYLGGMMMQATWPDKDQERGVPNCNVLVIYQRGICIIETKEMPVGEFIPVTIKFVYNDQTFSAQTGFTIK